MSTSSSGVSFGLLLCKRAIRRYDSLTTRSLFLLLDQFHLLESEQALVEPLLEGEPLEVFEAQEAKKSIYGLWLPVRFHGTTAGELDRHVDVLIYLCVSTDPIDIDGEALLALEQPGEPLLNL